MPPDLSHDCVSCISELHPHLHPSQHPGAHWDVLLRCPGCLLLQNLQHLGGGGGGVPHSSIWDQPSQNSFLSCFWKVSSAQSLPRPPAMTSMPRGSLCQLHLPLKLFLGPHGFPQPLPGFLQAHFLWDTARRSIRCARSAGCLTRGGLVSRVRSEAPWRRGTGLSRS